jgi:hypothetical protein
MKRTVLILICVAGLLAAIPAFAAQAPTPPQTPNVAPAAVAPVAQPAAPSVAALPAWLAPADAPLVVTRPWTGAQKPTFVFACTFNFCHNICDEGCCKVAAGSCACC